MSKISSCLKIANYLGEAFTTAYAVLLVVVFYLAYYDPAHTVIINVNAFGEAGVEFLVVTASIPFIVVAIVRSVLAVRDEFEEHRMSNEVTVRTLKCLITVDNRIYVVGIVTILLGVIVIVLCNVSPILVGFIFAGLKGWSGKTPCASGEMGAEPLRH